MSNTVNKYLKKSVMDYPDKICLVDNKSRLSFKQLWINTNRVATYFIENHFFRVPVVVYINKSINCLTGMLGIAQSGNFYTPIDTTMPISRVNTILETLQPACIVTDTENYELIFNLCASKMKVLLIEDILQTEENHNLINEIEKKIIDTDILYVLFTSGSTGVPKGVTINHRSVIDYAEWVTETFHITLDGMKMSSSKFKAIQESKFKDESILSYFFPLLRFHSRFSDLTSDDLEYMFYKPEMFHNGFYLRVGVNPLESYPRPKKLSSYVLPEKNMMYLEKIVEMCAKNKITLFLVKAPSSFPYWYPEWDTQMIDFAKQKGIKYMNLFEQRSVIPIDYNTDTYDAGLHLNVDGAEKLTKYFGRILIDELHLKDRRNNLNLSKIWNEKNSFYNNDKLIKTKKYEMEK